MMPDIIHAQFTANIYHKDSKQKLMGTSFVYKMHIYSKSLIFTLPIINLVDIIKLNFYKEGTVLGAYLFWKNKLLSNIRV